MPLFEAGAVVALSESDSTISPSDGDEEGETISKERKMALAGT